MTHVIQVQQLTKSYGPVRAVDGLSFTVRSGEIFGLLGPNGAGKTTTLSIIEGILPPDEGRVEVLGLDVSVRPREVKRRIGVQLQQTSLIRELRAWEQVALFGRLYGVRMDRKRAMALLARVGLDARANAYPDALSGGQRKRLTLALALVNDPDILFLDEPTTGLDPQARRALWDIVRDIAAQGRTVVLTTHYLEEAEALCHRVGLMDGGRLIALDTPAGLIRRAGLAAVIHVHATTSLQHLAHRPEVLAIHQEGQRFRIHTRDVAATLQALTRETGVDASSIHIQQPSLEDAFIQLTGRRLHA